MAIKKQLLEQDDQFVISYELLYIFHWILKYEQHAFKELVYRAFAQGIDDTSIRQDLASQVQNSEDMQNSIVDFFTVIEEYLRNIADEASTKNIMHNQVLKTLAHIDPKRFDPSTIKSSMVAAAEKIDVNNQSQAKEFLLKELLKQWNPKKGAKDFISSPN